MNSEKKNILKCDSAALESICKDFFKLKESAEIALRQGRSDGIHEAYSYKFHQLSVKCSRFTGLSITDNSSMETLHYIFLEPFGSLREIHLYMCPPSTVLDLFEFRDRLEVVEMVNSGIPDISHIFAPVPADALRNFKPKAVTQFEEVNISASLMWDKLTQLRLTNCGLVGMDESFHLMPKLELLDLSHNEISRIYHLQDCYCLRSLNLSFNRIATLKSCSRVLGNLKSLDLSGNRLVTIRGLEKLISLAQVNLADNLIEDYRELNIICKLPFLEGFCLIGNPISAFPEYRILVFQYLLMEGSVLRSGREVPSLDGFGMTEREISILRSVMFRAMPDSEGFTSHNQRGKLPTIDDEAAEVDQDEQERAFPIGLPDHILGLVKSGAYNGPPCSSKRRLDSEESDISSLSDNEEGTSLLDSLKALKDEWWSILSGAAYQQQQQQQYAVEPRSKSTAATMMGSRQQSFSRNPVAIEDPLTSLPSQQWNKVAFKREDSWVTRDSFSGLPSISIDQHNSQQHSQRQQLTQQLLYESNKSSIAEVLKQHKYWSKKFCRAKYNARAQQVRITCYSSSHRGTSASSAVEATPSYCRKNRVSIDLNEAICNHGFLSPPDLDIIRRTRSDRRQNAKAYALEQKLLHLHLHAERGQDGTASSSAAAKRLGTRIGEASLLDGVLHAKFGSSMGGSATVGATAPVAAAALAGRRPSATGSPSIAGAKAGSTSSNNNSLGVSLTTSEYIEEVLAAAEATVASVNTVSINATSPTASAVAIAAEKVVESSEAVVQQGKQSERPAVLSQWEQQKLEREQRRQSLSKRIDSITVEIEKKEQAQLKKIVELKAPPVPESTLSSTELNEKATSTSQQPLPSRLASTEIVKSLVFDPDHQEGRGMLARNTDVVLASGSSSSTNIDREHISVSNSLLLTDEREVDAGNEHSELDNIPEVVSDDEEEDGVVVGVGVGTVSEGGDEADELVMSTAVADGTDDNNDEVSCEIQEDGLKESVASEVEKSATDAVVVVDTVLKTDVVDISVKTAETETMDSIAHVMKALQSEREDSSSELDVLLQLHALNASNSASSSTSAAVDIENSINLPIDVRMNRRLMSDSVSRSRAMGQQQHQLTSLEDREDDASDDEAVKEIKVQADTTIVEEADSVVPANTTMAEIDIESRSINKSQLGLEDYLSISLSTPSAISAAYAALEAERASNPIGYIGDPNFSKLSVLDNLELYFQEQVFNPRRPSGNSAYLTFSSTQSMSKRPQFVPEPPFPETYVNLFSVSTIDITTDCQLSASVDIRSSSTGGVGVGGVGSGFGNGNGISVTSNSNAKVAAATAAGAADNELAEESTETKGSSPNRKNIRFKRLKMFRDARNKLGQEAPTDDSNAASTTANTEQLSLFDMKEKALSKQQQQQPTQQNQLLQQQYNHKRCSEEDMIIVLTTVSCYIIPLKCVKAGDTFGDAPVLTLLRAHPIHQLSQITIFFAHQRFIIQFKEERRMNGFEVADNIFRCSPLYGNYSSFLYESATCYAYQLLSRDKVKSMRMLNDIGDVCKKAKKVFYDYKLSKEELLRYGETDVVKDSTSALSSSPSYSQSDAMSVNSDKSRSKASAVGPQSALSIAITPSMDSSATLSPREQQPQPQQVNSPTSDAAASLVEPTPAIPKKRWELPATRDAMATPTESLSSAEAAMATATKLDIVNKTDKFMKKIQELVLSQQLDDAEADIRFYHMLFQDADGSSTVASATVSAQSAVVGSIQNQVNRSLIVTPSVIFLCEEDLYSMDVKLEVIDSALVKDVISIKCEQIMEDPLCVTIALKSSKGIMFTTKRKWKLRCVSKAARDKMTDEIKRQCGLSQS